MVYVVWRNNRSKKWFHVADRASCPLVKAEKKRYRLGLCAVILQQTGENYTKITLKEDVMDRINMRNSFQMLNIGKITTYDYKVEY